MKKHAYLIMAHKDDFTFHTLIELLDNEKNDLFIHMDKKVKSYDYEAIERSVTYSSVFHVERTDVKWGGYSQIIAELLLIEAALKQGDYNFFHLLSGEDLPLKTNDYIYNFFEQFSDKNFVRFQSPTFIHEERIKYHYFFQDTFGRIDNKIKKIIHRANLKIQKIIGVNRNSDIKFQKGTNWFSINYNLASYVLKKKDFIEETFKNTLSADEVFLQTIVHNSEFKDTLYHSSYDNNLRAIMRLIDWERGKPYTFRNTDFEELTNSPYLFARKFDSKIDKDIILNLKEYINGKK